MALYVAQRNGRAATAEELAPLAFAGYAHFTAMQVRGGRVRGLDLHLDRLRSASLELFGRAVPDDRVRSFLRSALAGSPGDVSLVATVSSGEFTADAAAEPDVLVRTGSPADGPAGPLALAISEHERFLPHVKQVGEAAKTYLLRQAAEAGADDAAFVDRRGRFSEGTIWNLAFWDGAAVVWPDAPMLRGTTMGIVRRQLDRLGVPQHVREITQADLPDLAGAAVLNSWTPGVAVHRIGSVPLPEAPSFLALLHRAYREEPLTAP
ncbi:Branched-chain amino acid aminotransferase/4-amino-4-deoxychorismate lyase [Amycolatopsis tolypomycina]|uniref:Branched-chain amino acid aminotransferase/4-amino-4-deoxychorismate lyase n=1 Tax=Amycolatopsis tolypomycina TaxID=208445 RepID=A0A1H4YHN8_9PSEU|nr:aminotransferase class IV family protein [Amycolatopsis tolypomycina]SED16770.1 Branched-chain amino acid aminotransferase/4-amino-4-deoxychorismate lyase [Amycolatopsis tolypomycina]